MKQFVPETRELRQRNLMSNYLADDDALTMGITNFAR